MDTRTSLPRHVAIIMDGNGRWAQHRKRPRVFGHRAGKNSVEKVIEAAADSGVAVLSFFAFSCENWGRPESEVQLIMELIQSNILQNAQRLKDKDIRILFIGDRTRLSASLQEAMQKAEEMTAHCQKMQVVFAINFSGRWEIVQTSKAIAQAIEAKELSVNEIDETVFNRYRPLSSLPAVDLLIRTSGEERISNFFLWDMAYAELYFTPTFWPDFDKEAFAQALDAFAKRQRRFGKIKE